MGMRDDHASHGSKPSRAIPIIPRLLLAAWFTTLVACAVVEPTRTLTTRPSAFPTTELEKQLTRGASEKTDVEKLLGNPDGTGSLLFPGQSQPREIWFYERLEIESTPRTIDIQQDVLLIFFRAEVYDGFMWFSDAEGPPVLAESRR